MYHQCITCKSMFVKHDMWLIWGKKLALESDIQKST